MEQYTEIGMNQESIENTEKLYGDLQLDYRERITATAVMLYLYRCGGNAATRLMNGIVTVKVFQMGTEAGSQTGAAVPVQSHIEGAQLAALIDTAVSEAVGLFETGWKPEEPEVAAMKEDVVGMLDSISGRAVVEGMSAEFAEFVVRCSRWVREL